ncbi:unnamed protein product, partial [Nesidiocoris tenuis]
MSEGRRTLATNSWKWLHLLERFRRQGPHQEQCRSVLWDNRSRRVEGNTLTLIETASFS